ncbi:Uncharacterised protein [Actinomyces bovis]|uniref:Centromere-binding protein ParB C-terminal domain-containing protein n=1 Tax=Actinomyces bovis TaxID=1658 RepID=A0ABY1VR18_9ACTO|nr:hypothetical protein [Actinomyces bovis]SPT55032.1 Uncharacterised protein [Actinomyces bovis]VEG56184.1 Uncharacterised protein [Actinomyces israelii]
MKPKPKPRKAITVPKATGPDPAELPAATNASKTSNAGQGEMRRLTVRISADDLGRARSAWRLVCARGAGDYPAFGAWVVAALNSATAEVEESLNGGESLAPTPAGVIPTGRTPR